MSNAVSNNLVIASVIDQLLNRTSNAEQERLQHNHQLCKTAASRVAYGPGTTTLEDTLLALASESDGKIISEEDARAFLNEQRQRLRTLAESNIASKLQLEANTNALNRLKNELRANILSTNVLETDYAALLEDYRREALIQLQQKIQSPMQDAYYLEIAEAMNDTDAIAAAANSRNGGGNDADDIEVVPTATAQPLSLKCPITGLLMENPVRNTVCQHVYSREGIMAHIRSKGNHVPCPVAGCSNRRIALNQIKDDVGVAIAVRREKRRLQAVQENQEQENMSVHDDFGGDI